MPSPMVDFANVSNAVSLLHGGFCTSLGLVWIFFQNSDSWFSRSAFVSIAGAKIYCMRE